MKNKGFGFFVSNEENVEKKAKKAIEIKPTVLGDVLFSLIDDF